MAAYNNNARLQGKVAVITAAASGIGEATVKLFTAQGAKVIVADINIPDGERVAREAGGPSVARFIQCDLSKEEHIAAAVDLAVTAFGSLDIMFNNAGILGPRCAIDETPADGLDYLYTVNLRSVFLGIKHAARVMKPQQKGAIISTASVAAHAGGVGPHAYTTFKHALVGLTRSAAFELRDYQIRVNAVSPGGVLTNIWDQIPADYAERSRIFGIAKEAKTGLQSLFTSADNIAKSVLFLASDDSAYVSGHTMIVDAGHTLARGW